MKKVLFLLVVSMMMASCRNQSQWQLVWEENFNGVELDTTVWSMIPRGKPDSQNTMSMDERCYELRDGQLILRGIINEDLQKDSSPYLTGGVWTKNKKSFVRGRVEIRAKLEGAQGAWPAIWMLPYEIEKYAWPEGGEVDIMERLNYDTFVYQTVHSHYTYHLKEDKNPPNGTTASIHPNDFNVYGVDFWPDSLVFHVNGVKTYTYPRIETDKVGQFPFDIAQYLLIDMQLGGTWVGEVDPTGLPVEMSVDWVKHYQWK
jgi:beta-glucanase (GH16 family)